MRGNLIIYGISTAIGLYWVLTDALDRYNKNNTKKSWT